MNLNKPKTIVFHPGIGKTATSKIQSIGLKLPTNISSDACFSPFGIYGGAHNHFSSIHPGFEHKKFESEWQKLLKFALDRESSTIVSSEFLIRDNPNHIQFLIKSAKEAGLDVKVVIATREYSEYLMSAFLQGVKVNWGIKPNETFIGYCQREIANIRYPMLVDRWANHVGDDNIYILDYTENKNTFVYDFFSLFNIDLPIEDSSSNKVNLSIPFEIAPIIRHFDNISGNPEVRKKIIELFSDLDFKPGFKHNNISKVKSEVVINKYQHDIERLKDRYNWIEKND